MTNNSRLEKYKRNETSPSSSPHPPEVELLIIARCVSPSWPLLRVVQLQLLIKSNIIYIIGLLLGFQMQPRSTCWSARCLSQSCFGVLPLPPPLLPGQSRPAWGCRAGWGACGPEWTLPFPLAQGGPKSSRLLRCLAEGHSCHAPLPATATKGGGGSHLFLLTQKKSSHGNTVKTWGDRLLFNPTFTPKHQAPPSCSA